MADGGLGNILSITSTILDPPDPGAEVCRPPSLVDVRGQSLPHQEIHVHPTYAHHWMCESSHSPSMNWLQVDKGIWRPGSRTLHETRLREYQETPSQQQSNKHHLSSLQPLCVSKTEIEESNWRGCQVPFYEDIHFNHPFSGRVYFDFNSQGNVEQSTVSQVVLSPEYHLFSQQSSYIAANLPQVEHLPDISQSSLDSQLQHREYALHNPMNSPPVMVESDVGMADGGLGNILSITSTILDPPDPGAEVCRPPSLVDVRGQSLPHQEIHVHPTYAHNWMCESSHSPSMNWLQVDKGIWRPGSRTLHETRLREYQETLSQQQSNEHHLNSLQPLCV
ncbi:hypothetical protein SK128_017940 [Halocaridina rubra]|uniref:Uncharacterized protein n=1 Tax=Halocaridina rubra TaxID=373956 RepID=A0AAN9AA31_HALRR